MATLTLLRSKVTAAPRRIVFFPVTRDEYNAVKALPGTYYAKDRITLPVDTASIDAVLAVVPHTVLDPELAKWRDALTERNAHMLSLKIESQQDRMRSADIALSWRDKLYPYQTYGVKFLSTVKRCILADEPGLGKTIQLLGACDEVQAQRVLIFANTATVQNQWADTIKKWGLGTASVVAGTKQQRIAALLVPARFYVCTTSMLQTRSAENAYAPYFDLNRWSVIICDEAHMLQGRESTRAKMFSKLRAEYIWLATGTPIWNRPDSLWKLLNICAPEKYSSYWTWVNKYFLVRTTPFGRTVKGIRQQMLEPFMYETAQLILRRTAHEVRNDLPEIVEHVHPVHVPTNIRLVYKEFRARIENGTYITFGDRKKFYDTITMATADMRQLLCMPDNYGIRSNMSYKTDVIAEICEKYTSGGKQVLVFCWHTKYVDYLAERLPQATSVHGKVSTADRAVRIADFRAGKYSILVAGIAALGTGVDLPDVTAVVFAETDFTQSNVEQAWRRIYRISITETKFVHFVYAENTVEERVMKMFNTKQKVSDALLATELLKEV